MKSIKKKADTVKAGSSCCVHSSPPPTSSSLLTLIPQFPHMSTQVSTVSPHDWDGDCKISISRKHSVAVVIGASHLTTQMRTLASQELWLASSSGPIGGRESVGHQDLQTWIPSLHPHQDGV
jgi:hypothetical protein